MAKKRVVFYTDDSFAQDTHHGMIYNVARITEGEPGYEITGGYSTPEAAAENARRMNVIKGNTEDDVQEVKISSMAAGKVNP